MLDNVAPSALIIDEDPTCAGALRPLLQGAGYEVHIVQDARDGLAILRASQPRLLALFHVDLTALTMSGLDGIAVLGARVREASLARHAYILMTEDPYAVALTFDRLLARLAIPVIAKPFVASDVRDVLTAVEAGRLGAQLMLDGLPA